jgi:hypothetical protein
MEVTAEEDQPELDPPSPVAQITSCAENCTSTRGLRGPKLWTLGDLLGREHAVVVDDRWMSAVERLEQTGTEERPPVSAKPIHSP